jgi:hypothetical protein
VGVPNRAGAETLTVPPEPDTECVKEPKLNPGGIVPLTVHEPGGDSGSGVRLNTTPEICDPCVTE